MKTTPTFAYRVAHCHQTFSNSPWEKPRLERSSDFGASGLAEPSSRAQAEGVTERAQPSAEAHCSAERSQRSPKPSPKLSTERLCQRTYQHFQIRVSYRGYRADFKPACTAVD